MSTSDPNTRTAGQNVKAILARYGYRRSDTRCLTLPKYRNHCLVFTDSLVRVPVENVARVLRSAGLQVTVKTGPSTGRPIYLEVEA